jgi:hypothetical protein
MLVLAFVTLIIGVVLISTVASEALGVTTKTNIADESTNLSTISCYTGGEVNETLAACNITVTNNPTGWKSNDCPLTNVVVTNNTGTALVLDTDYNLFASTGIVKMLNTTDTTLAATAGVVKIDYTYCGDDYLNLSWARTFVNLIAGFFALALMLISVGLFYNVAKANGIF